ncbi:MAG: hypothetical protein KDE32_07810 [Novosphingobium sp.]|nr:hypothetical protein [Novosphingobium sp.]
MVITIAYLAVLGATFAYLAAYGGRTGLWGGGLLIVTSLISLVIALAFAGTAIAATLLTIVDVASLVWRMWLAFWSTRRWPIWIAGFQLNVVAAHVSIWFVPSWRGELYYAMITVWAVPTLLAMVIGTSLDNRHAMRTRQPA